MKGKFPAHLVSVERDYWANERKRDISRLRADIAKLTQALDSYESTGNEDTLEMIGDHSRAVKKAWESLEACHFLQAQEVTH